MNKRQKSFARFSGAVVSLFFLLFTVVAQLAPTGVAAQTTPEFSKDCVVASDCPVAQADFFDNTKDPNINCPAGKGFCYAKVPDIKLSVAIGDTTKITDIGQWVRVVYVYGIGIATILAAVMMMIGGIIWLTAADSSRVDKAKGMISDALVGLVLAMGAYTILQTVNPDTLELRTPRPKYVKAKPINKGVVRCVGYSTREDCLADPKHVGGDTKCIWMADIGGPHACAQMDENIGKNGGICGEGCANGLKCVKNIPYGGGGTQDVCSDGAVGSRCSCDGDAYCTSQYCASGLKCAKIFKNVYYCSDGSINSHCLAGGSGVCQAGLVCGDNSLCQKSVQVGYGESCTDNADCAKTTIGPGKTAYCLKPTPDFDCSSDPSMCFCGRKPQTEGEQCYQSSDCERNYQCYPTDPEDQKMKDFYGATKTCGMLTLKCYCQ